MQGTRRGFYRVGARVTLFNCDNFFSFLGALRELGASARTSPKSWPVGQVGQVSSQPPLMRFIIGGF
jgi:hypothetical protein